METFPIPFLHNIDYQAICDFSYDYKFGYNQKYGMLNYVTLMNNIVKNLRTHNVDIIIPNPQFIWNNFPYLFYLNGKNK